MLVLLTRRTSPALAFALLGLLATGCPDGDEDSPTSATEGEASSTDTDGDPTTSDVTASGGDPSPTTTDAPMTTTTATTADATDSDPTTTDDPPTCGDGQVDPGEECDWGMGNSEEAGCTPDCELAKCGDGLVQLGVEECDDGLANDDSGACTLDCTKARCGDDKVYEGVEECDDGDTPTEEDKTINDDNAYGGCTTECKAGPHCGDGKVYEGVEECDDGEEPDPAVCSKECTVLRRVIFVSSETYLGDLGGIEGGDQKCRNLAESAALSNSEKFRAWLSGNGQSPLDWADVDPENRYQLPSGTIVADDWAQLVSGGLKAFVDQTEAGIPLEDGALVSVWTGTLADGSPAPWTCNGWTSDGGLSGRIGLSIALDHHWTDFSDEKCQSDAHLYCVEVW